jgi:hypothetical protein
VGITSSAMAFILIGMKINQVVQMYESRYVYSLSCFSFTREPVCPPSLCDGLHVSPVVLQMIEQYDCCLSSDL